MVVTLEPCAHQGKQPPCTEAIIHVGHPARGGRAARPESHRGRRRRAAATGRHRGRARPSRGSSRGPERHLPPFHPAPRPPFRRAQAGDHARRPHRRPLRPRRAGSPVRKRATTSSGSGPASTPSRWAAAPRGWTILRSPCAARSSPASRRAGWSSTAAADLRSAARPGPERRGSPDGGRRRLPRPTPLARQARWRRRASRVLRADEPGRRRCGAPRAGDQLAAGRGRRAAGRRAAGGGPGGPVLLGSEPALAGRRRGPGGGRTPDRADGPGGALAGGRAPRAGRGHPARAGSALMFTGIITAVGTVRAGATATPAGSSSPSRSYPDLEPGESIAVDGACLTVAGARPGGFTAHVMRTSLERTRFADLRRRPTGEPRARAPGRRPAGRAPGAGPCGRGGHGRAGGASATTPGCSTSGCPPRSPGSRCPLGSITVDGVSLTVNAIPAPDLIQISLIPFTLQHTTLGERRAGRPGASRGGHDRQVRAPKRAAGDDRGRIMRSRGIHDAPSAPSSRRSTTCATARSSSWPTTRTARTRATSSARPSWSRPR